MFFKDISYHYKVNQNKEITMIQICESNNYIQTLMEKKDKKIAWMLGSIFKDMVLDGEIYENLLLICEEDKSQEQTFLFINEWIDVNSSTLTFRDVCSVSQLHNLEEISQEQDSEGVWNSWFYLDYENRKHKFSLSQGTQVWDIRNGYSWDGEFRYFVHYKLFQEYKMGKSQRI